MTTTPTPASQPSPWFDSAMDTGIVPASAQPSPNLTQCEWCGHSQPSPARSDMLEAERALKGIVRVVEQDRTRGGDLDLLIGHDIKTLTEFLAAQGTQPERPAESAPSGEMSKSEIDEIVYRCRQSGHDTTYDIVNAALARRATAGTTAAPSSERIVIHNFETMLTNCIAATSPERRKEACDALLEAIRYEVRATASPARRIRNGPHGWVVGGESPRLVGAVDSGHQGVRQQCRGRASNAGAAPAIPEPLDDVRTLRRWAEQVERLASTFTDERALLCQQAGVLLYRIAYKPAASSDNSPVGAPCTGTKNFTTNDGNDNGK